MTAGARREGGLDLALAGLLCWWLVDGRGIGVDLAILAAGALLVALGAGLVAPAGVAPLHVRPLLLAGWIAAAIGLLRTSSRFVVRRHVASPRTITLPA